MKTKIIAISLFALTTAIVTWYPGLPASGGTNGADTTKTITAMQSPVVDVVFVLDTTGSMSGLIQTAREKIWSIASTMASARPTPTIRVGLVGYRDRGDAYVTRVVDLSDNLDAVYAELMQFEAGGGGDTPESVNAALYAAVHAMSWSRADNAYQAIFLVGDAPPHMDYDEIRYPQIVAAANEKGIVINTIQCGELPLTIEPWTAIANLGQGRFFQVEQSGGAVAFASPYDAELAELAAKLDGTRLYYGSAEEQARAEEKVAAADLIRNSASVESRARRGVFNAADGGRANLLGENELVDALASGEVSLDEIDGDDLPAALKPMAPEERADYVGQLATERTQIQQRIRQLADERDAYIAEKVEEAGGLDDSLDKKLYEAVKSQAGKAGLDYEDGPVY